MVNPRWNAKNSDPRDMRLAIALISGAGDNVS